MSPLRTSPSVTLLPSLVVKCASSGTRLPRCSCTWTSLPLYVGGGVGTSSSASAPPGCAKAGVARNATSRPMLRTGQRPRRRSVAIPSTTRGDRRLRARCVANAGNRRLDIARARARRLRRRRRRRRGGRARTRTSRLGGSGRRRVQQLRTAVRRLDRRLRRRRERDQERRVLRRVAHDQLHRVVDLDVHRTAGGVLAVLVDVAHLVGLVAERGLVHAAVVRGGLHQRGVVHVERLQRDDRHVHEHRAADTDDDDADRVELVGITLRSAHGYMTSWASERPSVGSLIGIRLSLRPRPVPARKTPTRPSHTVMSTAEKPTWWSAMLPASGPWLIDAPPCAATSQS